MGLTIHYSLGSSTRSPTKARELVGQLRSHALDLPFEQVGEMIELKGDQCNFESRDQADPHRWLLVQAGRNVPRPIRGGGCYFFPVVPTHVIAFETLPGPGCEAANFGLCRFPANIEIEERYDSGRKPGLTKKRLRTGLSGWCWSSFSKTQYASNSTCGGVQNFLRCHLAIIRLLEHAQSLELLKDVDDEGRFWENGDVQALVEEIGQWNQMMAAFVGRVKDWYQADYEAPITTFPDFEHLEARGRTAE